MELDREHRLSKDKPYPSVGDILLPKTSRKTVDECDCKPTQTTSSNIGRSPVTSTTNFQGSSDRTVVFEALKNKMNVGDINAALDARHDEMTAEELTYLVQTNFSGSLLSLRQLKPFIEEIKRRFKHLPRKMGVDGEYKKISGHRNFKFWCASILHRSDRAVRYMLAKASNTPNKNKLEDETETISVVSARVGKYLTDRAKKFEGSERIQFLKAVEKIVKELHDEEDATRA
jgi:hypothetical protein